MQSLCRCVCVCLLVCLYAFAGEIPVPDCDHPPPLIHWYDLHCMPHGRGGGRGGGWGVTCMHTSVLPTLVQQPLQWTLNGASLHP